MISYLKNWIFTFLLKISKDSPAPPAHAHTAPMATGAAAEPSPLSEQGKFFPLSHHSHLSDAPRFLLLFALAACSLWTPQFENAIVLYSLVGTSASDEDIEVLRGKVTCPRSPGKIDHRPGLGPRVPSPGEATAALSKASPLGFWAFPLRRLETAVASPTWLPPHNVAARKSFENSDLISLCHSLPSFEKKEGFS